MAANDLVRSFPFPRGETEPLLTHEWIVTNGLGGYASGTILGAVTRRYHGFLIAALPAPLGRLMLLPQIAESFRAADGTTFDIGGEERADGSSTVIGAAWVNAFELRGGLPVWRYQIGDAVIERRILMPHLQNTVHVTYRLVSGAAPVRIKLRPTLQFRPHDAPVSTPLGGPYVLTAAGDRYEVTTTPDFPTLRFYVYGARKALTLDPRTIQGVHYRLEGQRGYESTGDMYSPGFFRADLSPGAEVTLVASTESWETLLALPPAQAASAEKRRRDGLLAAAPPGSRRGQAAELVLAADQFIIAPAGRVQDAARARAAGDEVRTVIAGYHWFTDWGRDTMISLEGLTLATGRRLEAGYILRTFAHYVKDGLIPNLFPEGEREGLYHTADASLWFFHALDRYLAVTADRVTLRLLLPTLQAIASAHRQGTRFGIGVDPADGLLRQGEEGYQLTWMDAKVADWVVTPRRGKAVEINALWYNAVRLLERWLREEDSEASARPLTELAERIQRSFNHRFWIEQGGCLHDVVDGEKGDDPSFRPNQIFAVSLPNPVLARERWKPVVDAVRTRLWTPMGLRSLAAGHPDYKPAYDGDLRSRDAAYHQGTVWAWLVGPLVDAWLKVYPGDKAGARKLLLSFDDHLAQACVGSISEVFDAEPPYRARGCIAQAWSVAEVLRAWLLTEG